MPSGLVQYKLDYVDFREHIFWMEEQILLVILALVPPSYLAR
jgi:hypothetical protein